MPCCDIYVKVNGFWKVEVPNKLYYPWGPAPMRDIIYGHVIKYFMFSPTILARECILKVLLCINPLMFTVLHYHIILCF